MKKRTHKVKFKIRAMVSINGVWYDAEEITTQLEKAKDNLVAQVYYTQLKTASRRTDAAQWTADLLDIDIVTVYRALKKSRQKINKNLSDSDMPKINKNLCDVENK